MAPDLPHQYVTVLHHQGQVRALCRCGWASPPVSRAGLAGAMLDEHVASASARTFVGHDPVRAVEVPEQGWVAGCSCGWRSAPEASEAVAAFHWVRHADSGHSTGS